MVQDAGSKSSLKFNFNKMHLFKLQSKPKGLTWQQTYIKTREGNTREHERKDGDIWQGAKTTSRW